MTASIATLQPKPLPDTVTARCRWGTTYTLKRGKDGMFHGRCASPVKGETMRFAIPEMVAREWVRNHREKRDLRATGQEAPRG